MDKLKAKELFRLHNVPTPPYYSITRQQVDTLRQVHGSFGYPVVVKPRREGSSVGVSIARDEHQLRAATEQALAHDETAVVERFIDGKEVAVGLLDGRVLGAIEIAPKGTLYDYQAKYESDETEYFMPARLEETRYRGVLNLAERAAAALDCRGAVRVDLLVTEGQNEYVLEVNTSPGMTQTSLMPKIAAAAGFDFQTLCAAIVAGAGLQSGLAPQPAEQGEQPLTAEPMRLAV
jgi:D-alanine-D-alanine ligase